MRLRRGSWLNHTVLCAADGVVRPSCEKIASVDYNCVGNRSRVDVSLVIVRRKDLETAGVVLE